MVFGDTTGQWALGFATEKKDAYGLMDDFYIGSLWSK
jgi:hypothetical protein